MSLISKRAKERDTKVFNKENVKQLDNIFNAYDVAPVNSTIKAFPTKPQKKEIVKEKPVAPVAKKIQPVKNSLVRKPEKQKVINEEYKTRKNAGKVELTYNGDLSDFSSSADDITTVELEKDLKPYKFMENQLQTKSEILDKRLDKYADAVIKSFPELGEMFVSEDDYAIPFHVQSQNECVVPLMVCAEDEGGLRAQVCFQGKNKNRVRARMAGRVDKLCMFPGEIVFAKGTNLTGHLFDFKQVYIPERLPFFERKPQEKNLSVVFASGPFTCASNLENEPLKDLISYITNTKPHLVILTGPFVDVNHPSVLNDELDSTFEEYFKESVMPQIYEICEFTQTVVIPSTDDIHHFTAFPQPAFDIAIPIDVDGASNLHFMPNPCTIRLNDQITIGVNSQDIINSIQKDCIANYTGEAITATCRALLQQRHYYPLFPPERRARVDFTAEEHLTFPDYTPDMFISPSTLDCFAKNIDDVLFLNPGSLAEGATGGTFAKLIITPETEKNTTVASRTRVDIVRI